MVERRNVCKHLVGNPLKKDQFEDLGIDGSVMLKWILGAWKV
jgi:hypothetical protein